MEQEVIEYLGLNYNSFKKLQVEVELLPSTIIKQNNFEVVSQLIQNAWLKNKTILDIALGTHTISWDDDKFSTFFPSDNVDVVAAVLHDELHMKLFPPKNMLFDGGVLDLPVFEVEYILRNVPKNIPNNDVVNSILKTQNKYEGEFLFEILGKAVRSQRNKIDKPLNIESISDALELIERENENPYHTLTNTKAFALIRNQIENNKFMSTDVLNFSPVGRVHKTRTYFLGDPNMIGRLAKTIGCQIEIENKGDMFDVSCLLRMGCVILNRSLISVIES